ncbi:ABC transporter substrate-binding protein [Aquibacillus koreensis]|uniref:ABC transporter substrate-binding protein n=1 Tax=Aquibacillus koreensis TaxID=279446 RepID=A0A9X4AJG6_9BACI|nr:ABC transporter substrate-binding protein [Aquibacillus koreensis]MCT2535392.1 ABC transporter substrate-binding protein [Aquibacillus koreensis]MDC3422227.1 ABC transporter substrate-binding protein [Aquibacillus koreensis]
MKRKSLLAILFGILAMFLVACGGDDEEAASTEADDVSVVGDDIEDATPLTFWTFAAQHVDFFVDAAERWNEENPDRPIELTAETYPFDQMHNNLLLALQSGNGAPDIADVEIARFPNYMEGEPQLEPMNEYVEPELDNFVSSRFEIYSKDGNYYGMPTHVGASVMYYNTEIMDAAGVDIDSIKTWDDFMAAGEKVVANTDAMMYNTFPGDYLPYFQLVSQQGSDFIDENDNLTINRQENIDALQLLLDMQEAGIAEVAPGNEPHAEEYYSYMLDGGAASVAMPIWYMGRFTDSMPDLKGKMVVRPMPAFEEGGNRSAGMGGTGTVVTNQSESTDLAKEFLAYAKLSEESNVKIWTVLGFDPIRHDVWDHPDVLESNKYFEYFGDDIFDTLTEIQDEINAINVSPHTPEVATEINTNTLNNVLRAGSETPEEALNAAQEAVESQVNN